MHAGYLGCAVLGAVVGDQNSLIKIAWHAVESASDGWLFIERWDNEGRPGYE
jgi:hypothetical protein